MDNTVKGFLDERYEPPTFVYYHEPLSRTLTRAEGSSLQSPVRYRESDARSFRRDEQTCSTINCQSFKAVFLVGTMRSGTTFLADLLGLHPDIVYCPFELKGIWSKVGGVSMASPRTKDTSCPALTAADARNLQAAALKIAFERVFKKNQHSKGKPGQKSEDALFLNKNPHLCNKLPFVNALFPGARFIWIYRDLTPVAASLKRLLGRNRWHYWPVERENKPRCWEYYSENLPLKHDRSRLFPGGDIKYLAEYWYESNKAVRDFSRGIPAARFLAVREEELIINPREILAGCQAFLGVPRRIPEAVDRVETGRNMLWVKQLDKRELVSIIQFINQHERGIDYIMGQAGLSLLWEKELRGVLKG